jgi:uncharacterized protein (DUF983 family)
MPSQPTERTTSSMARKGPLAGTKIAPADANRSPVILTMLIVAVMAVAIAVDASSEPALSVLTIVVLGGLIVALGVWG